MNQRKLIESGISCIQYTELVYFSEITQSTTMKQLLWEKGFDEIIAEAEIMSNEELTKHPIFLADLEIKNKLKLLGLPNHQVENGMHKAIDQRQSPNFQRVAETLKHGK